MDMCSSLLYFLFLQYTMVVLAHNQSEYGKTWMYMPDGNDEPQIANLTQPPEEESESEANLRSGTSEKDVYFLLFTRKNPDVFSELSLDSAENSKERGNVSEKPFDDDYFDTSKNVKIVTHGWRSSGQSETVLNIKDAYLTTRDYNVIIVDWEKLAAYFFYFISVANTKIVGKKTARLIDYLIEDYGMSPDQFHIVGHSLGAHVSGYTGSFVKNGKISRVTGLDPAKPGFEHTASTDDRLDETDAQFVDVIHTCAGILGYYEPLGHSDFYPNDGTPPQPGCEGPSQILGNTLLEVYEYFKSLIFAQEGSQVPNNYSRFSLSLEACSHARAHKYFVESIYTGGFLGRSCPDEKTIGKSSCNGNEDSMGEYTNRENQGVFYLETNPEEPYSKS